MEETIVCAFPGFALLILAEFSRGVATRRNTYRVDAAINNMSLGNLRRVTEVYTNVFQVSLYAMCYEALWPTHQTQFCSAWYGYLAAVVFVVFCGYWARRCSRNMGVLWTAHVARQQSLAFNFPTVLLLESAYPILVFVFFMTPAMLGVPPAVFAVSWLVVLLCQAWLHADRLALRFR